MSRGKGGSREETEGHTHIVGFLEVWGLLSDIRKLCIVKDHLGDLLHPDPGVSSNPLGFQLGLYEKRRRK